MASNSKIWTDTLPGNDPSWIAVDDYTLSHLNHHQHLDRVLADTVDAGLPAIATYPGLAKSLAMQVYVTGTRHALEVGTLGGYTPIWLTTLNPDLRVTTVEVSEEHAAVARRNFARVLGDKWTERIELLVGPGREVLAQLRREVEAGTRERYGLTYIDADKENNWFYLDNAVAILHPRASVYVDNIVRGGSLVGGFEDGDTANAEARHNPRVLGSREVVEKVGKDSRVEGVVLQTVSGKSWDGHLWAVVK